VKRLWIAGAVCAVLLQLECCAAAGAASTADDRIFLSADGATLTGTDGGGGGSLAWLHNFDANTLAGVGAEHQGLGPAQWTFGSLNGALTVGPDDQKYSLYADAHGGAGDDGPRAFHYHIENAGVIGTYFHHLSAQLEDRRIDVETTHGNLPKIGLSNLWDPHWLTSAAYSHSVNGNLGTRLGQLRVDHYGAAMNVLAGVSFGQASPWVLNNLAQIVAPAHHLKEGYAGISKPVPRWRGEWLLVGDYQDLAGSKHVIITLSYNFHVGAVEPATR